MWSKCGARYLQPPLLIPDAVDGRRIDELSTCVGAYGMGGPGFFGIRLSDEWLVVAIWGAGDWILADGCLITDSYYDDYERPRPWILSDEEEEDDDQLSPLIVGRKILSLDVGLRTLDLAVAVGPTLSIAESPDTRQLLETTKEPRVLEPEDDLRRAVFLAPTDELWI